MVRALLEGGAVKRSSVIVALAVALAAPAHADPARAEPRAFVGGGILFGVDANYPASALDLVGGVRLTGGPAWSLWGRALVAQGGEEAGSGLYAPIHDSYRQGRGGLEARACSGGGGVCVLGRVDAGYRELQTRGDHGQGDSWIVVPQLGFDVGVRAVRLAVALDVLVDRTGGDGGMLDAQLEVRWW